MSEYIPSFQTDRYRSTVILLVCRTPKENRRLHDKTLTAEESFGEVSPAFPSHTCCKHRCGKRASPQLGLASDDAFAGDTSAVCKADRSAVQHSPCLLSDREDMLRIHYITPTAAGPFQSAVPARLFRISGNCACWCECNCLHPKV